MFEAGMILFAINGSHSLYVDDVPPRQHIDGLYRKRSRRFW